MNFNNEKPIYMQMADRLCDVILAGVYNADDRVPSVREYAVMLQVNSNTVVKAYEQLARDGVIYNKRGIGYFVDNEAKDKITKTRKNEFIEKKLPLMFKDMKLLGITFDEVEQAWRKNIDAGQ